MQNLNINKADSSLSDLSLKKQEYNLAIVGSGISCTYTLINYINLLKKRLNEDKYTQLSNPVKVAIFDKSGEFWTGIPYGNRTGKHSLIITSLEEFLPQPERDRFTAWLADNYDTVLDSLRQRSGTLTNQWLKSYQDAIALGNWDELFVPRYVFGWYLKDTVEQFLKEATSQGYLQCSLFGTEVLNIQKSQDSYQIEYAATLDNPSLTAEKVVLAIGSPPNKLSFVEQLEDSVDVCFIRDMYEPAQKVNLDRIVKFLKKYAAKPNGSRRYMRASPLSEGCREAYRSEQNQVLIIGSNASALETVYSLSNLREANDLIDKFIVISPNGEFPHRIGNNSHKSKFIPQSLVALSKLKDITAKQILEAVKQDVALALKQGETVDSTYKIISKEVISLLNQLSFKEQKQFVIKYGVEIGKFQRRAGRDYLNVVDWLILDNRLQFIKGKFTKAIDLNGEHSGFEFVNANNQIEKFEGSIKVIINCAGFQNLRASSSPLIGNLIQHGICTPNDSLCGFEMNENFEANENLYLMGPLVAGNINAKLKIWHAESCGRIIHLSQQLAEALV